jgi:hypothetical protein
MASNVTDTSRLLEVVSPQLLDEANKYEIKIIDGMTQRQLQTFFKEVTINNPFSFDPAPFLGDEPIMDLPKFYEIAGDLIADAQVREGILADERVVLVQEYQPERFYSMGDETVTVRILKREPANMSRDGRSRPQRASGFSHEFRAPSTPNKVIIVESRPIDHKIEFTCWAKTSTLANRRALWLEKLFITHAWAFQVQGADRFFWVDRGPDELWKHEEQRLHRRPLRFMLRLREFEVFAHPVLKRIDYSVSPA